MQEQRFIQLYKYLPFNSDEDIKIGKDSLRILTEATIKFTNPATFNDPFDCRPSYSDDFICGLLDRNQEIIPALAAHAGVVSENGNEVFSAAFRAMRSKPGAKAVFNLFLKNAGVLCLTRDPYNILMWSHYADYHRGFLVGFKISSNEVFIYENGIKLTPVKVEYVKNRPEMQHGDWSSHAISKKHIFLKSKHWKYEREYRIVDLRRGDGAYKFNPKTLNCVIAGMNAEDKHRKNIKDRLEKFNKDNGTNAVFFDASPCSMKYNVEIQGLQEYLSKY